VILAEWAGVAIEKARAYERSEHQRGEYERAVLELQATLDIALAAGDATGPDRVLELVAKRARVLIDAQSRLVMLRDRAELVIAASSGNADPPRGRRVPVSDPLWEEVIESRSPLRIHLAPGDCDFPTARTALLVPMLHLGAAFGVLAGFDRGIERAPFTEHDEKRLQNFAAIAANAVAIAKRIDPHRPHTSPAAEDDGQHKPAHALVEEMLQILDGIQETFSTALRHPDRDHYETTIREANETIARALRNLRSAVMTDDAP